MRLRFTKMQGLGNDFVVLDATQAPFPASPALLRRFSDRRFGVGCDQVLVVEPPDGDDVDFRYRIFNADGSEVGQCGNGARCLARFIRDRGLSDKSRLRIRTSTSRMELQLLPDGRVRVDMGVPRFEPAAVPLRMPERLARYPLTLQDGSRIEVGAVSLGNPHAVMEVADVAAAPVATVGSALQSHPAFPERVNAGFLQVVDAQTARLRVYERGAGETLACGSGACAAAVVGRLWGRLGPRVGVSLPGGDLLIEWEGEGRPVHMTGPAITVFEGELEWSNPVQD